MSELVLFVILLLVSFVCTGVEAALLSLSPARVRHFARLEYKPAMRLEQLLQLPDRLFVSILILTNLCNIGALALLLRFATNQMGEAGYFVAGLAAIPLWLVLLGVIPKGLFRRMPDRALTTLVVPLESVTRLLDPITRLFERIPTSRTSASPALSRSAGASREELKFLADTGERTGDLSPIERAMIHDVLDFRSLTAESIMIPWERVVSVPLNATCEAILAIAKEHNVDRMPVLTPNGKVAGLVLTLDVLFDGKPGLIAKNFLRHVVTVPLREPAYRLMRKLRAARITLAVVESRSGTPLGIVANEDLVGRLVRSAAQAASDSKSK
jgi:CBS domain containing-hemolysin-like protein